MFKGKTAISTDLAKKLVGQLEDDVLPYVQDQLKFDNTTAELCLAESTIQEVLKELREALGIK
jgi:hypothetical protein